MAELPVTSLTIGKQVSHFKEQVNKADKEDIRKSLQDILCHPQFVSSQYTRGVVADTIIEVWSNNITTDVGEAIKDRLLAEENKDIFSDCYEKIFVEMLGLIQSWLYQGEFDDAKHYIAWLEQDPKFTQYYEDEKAGVMKSVIKLVKDTILNNKFDDAKYYIAWLEQDEVGKKVYDYNKQGVMESVVELVKNTILNNKFDDAKHYIAWLEQDEVGKKVYDYNKQGVMESAKKLLKSSDKDFNIIFKRLIEDPIGKGGVEYDNDFVKCCVDELDRYLQIADDSFEDRFIGDFNFLYDRLQNNSIGKKMIDKRKISLGESGLKGLMSKLSRVGYTDISDKIMKRLSDFCGTSIIDDNTGKILDAAANGYTRMASDIVTYGSDACNKTAEYIINLPYDGSKVAIFCKLLCDDIFFNYDHVMNLISQEEGWKGLLVDSYTNILQKTCDSYFTDPMFDPKLQKESCAFPVQQEISTIDAVIDKIIINKRDNGDIKEMWVKKKEEIIEKRKESL